MDDHLDCGPKFLSTSAERVARHTTPYVQDEIERRLDNSVRYFAEHPDEIDDRLRDLDAEWDIERALETMASSMTLGGLLMSLLGSRRWILLPVIVQGFFLQHALQGWCPPVPALRRLGFRTMAEIHHERYALKALRGDFAQVGPVDDAERDRQALARRAMFAADRWS